MTGLRVALAGALLLPSWVAAAAVDCEFAAADRIAVGNGSDVEASLRANDQGGIVHLGRRVFVADGTSVAASRVELWNAASVFDVSSGSVSVGRGATVRGTLATTSPVPDPSFCAIASPTCGGADVVVHRGEPPRDLGPGSYGAVALENGTSIRLAAGRYDLCMLRSGRNATIEVVDPAATEIRVTGDVVLENGSTLGANAPGAEALLTSGGRLVKLGAGAQVRGRLHAPNATVRIGRGATIAGEACATRVATARNVTLGCGAGSAPSTTTVTTTSSTTTTTSTSSTTTSTSTSSSTAPTTSSTSTSAAPTTTTSSTSTSSSTSIAPTTSTSPTTSSSTTPTTSTTSTSAAPPTTTSTTTSTSTTSEPGVSTTTIVTTSTTTSSSSSSTSSSSTTSAPSTTSTSTTTSSSTSTTTQPIGTTCDGDGVVARVAVSAGNLGGAVAQLHYSTAVTFPGSDFETDPNGDHLTDVTGRNGVLLGVDTDTNADGVDDRLRLTYVLTGGVVFGPGAWVDVRFDCTPGVPVAASDITCEMVSASDAGGNPVAGVTCEVQSLQ